MATGVPEELPEAVPEVEPDVLPEAVPDVEPDAPPEIALPDDMEPLPPLDAIAPLPEIAPVPPTEPLAWATEPVLTDPLLPLLAVAAAPASTSVRSSNPSTALQPTSATARNADDLIDPVTLPVAFVTECSSRWCRRRPESPRWSSRTWRGRAQFRRCAGNGLCRLGPSERRPSSIPSADLPKSGAPW
jgi:hypothetical protein